MRAVTFPLPAISAQNALDGGWKPRTQGKGAKDDRRHQGSQARSARPSPPARRARDTRKRRAHMAMSVTISAATAQDAEQILKLQYLCYQSEAELYRDWGIEPLTQTLEALRAELSGGVVLVARLGEEVVGSVRGTVDGDGTAHINKLIVHPRLQRHGLGGRLLAALETSLAAEQGARRFRLFTGHRSEGNLRLYRRCGYVASATERVSPKLSLITLEKAAVAEEYATSA
ncbi:GNAT family N-acetyltransferase [Streptomyces sp. WMMC1477]|uniref:GNAT family N-acetyltransferase n=1 Tax=Streptomyces sp. WMMC1477 TaxID=3015155 RepID=UPI0022B5F7C9|nr:GNAT family N-acetyltransferase [Streptomyces sp. WMMC1477]MCZ7430336.1 GNAT family N-acetyltransferase [Streptomyces sp. WMMC1477]